MSDWLPWGKGGATHLLALNDPERLRDRRGGGDLVRLRCTGDREWRRIERERDLNWIETTNHHLLGTGPTFSSINFEYKPWERSWVSWMKRSWASPRMATFINWRTAASSSVWWRVSAWRTSALDWWSSSNVGRACSSTLWRWIRFSASLRFGATFLLLHEPIELFQRIVNDAVANFLCHSLIRWCNYIRCGQRAVITRAHLMRHHWIVVRWHGVSVITATNEWWPLHILRRLVRVVLLKTIETSGFSMLKQR